MGTTGRQCSTRRKQMIFSAFLTLLLFASTPLAMAAADVELENCPLSTHRYNAKLNAAHLTAAVGETVALVFSLDPSKPPQGFFIAVNMRAIHEPGAAKTNKPEILTGFPETRIVFNAPGEYKYEVVVSLIAKSSCGGVKADTIFNGEARIDIKQ